jgi:tetratricopeptide (TPR) repeat protein
MAAMAFASTIFVSIACSQVPRARQVPVDRLHVYVPQTSYKYVDEATRQLIMKNSIASLSAQIEEDGDEFAYQSRASWYYLLDQYDLALEDYRTAIEMSPFNAALRCGLASVLLSLDKPTEALAASARGLELEEDNATCLIAMAEAYAMLGDFARALEILDGVMPSEEIDPYKVRAKILLITKKPDDAISDLRHYVDKFKADAEAYLYLGIAELEAGQASEAIESFSRAIELYPEEAEFFERRAMAYSSVGSMNAAHTDLQRAKELRKNET